MTKRCDFAIINRSFWPKSKIIGEALLQLAEKSAENHKVSVITQSDVDLKAELANAGRGECVVLRACKARSNSATHLVWRIVDALIFMLWTFWSLVLTRPKKVYISTDPPVLVPFIVFVYAKLFRASYVYHLQDIHPEAANIIIPLNKWVYKVLRRMDAMVMRNAEAIVTLTYIMREVIIERSKTNAPIYLVDNPATFGEGSNDSIEKQPGLVFTGNAGRLQRIPLLLDSIRAYYQQGGSLPFVFAGGGVFSGEIAKLSDEFEQVSYLGVISPNEAQALNSCYEWALLPINDEVTKFAFPSKTSAYLTSGVSILSICSSDTSVGKWVKENGYGFNVAPNPTELVKALFAIEGREIEPAKFDNTELIQKLSIDSFVESLNRIVFEK
ncbi:glycosyltransferase [Thiomicrospira pelophila]|uniref:glycosyltransferase n=1 Tax=Thiomicrospira pelophila TaxID=934 RepID=UPI0004A76653|nr:glycosyltransferase [Thiomicrospira pelophila]